MLWPRALSLSERQNANLPVLFLPQADDFDGGNDLPFLEVTADYMVSGDVPDDPEQEQHLNLGAQAFYRYWLLRSLEDEAQAYADYVRTRKHYQAIRPGRD